MTIAAHAHDYRESEVIALREALKLANDQLRSKSREALELERLAASDRLELIELHHRLRNTFQLLTFTLKRQEQSVRSTEAAQAIASARCRIVAMSAVHNRLSEGGKSDVVMSGAYLNDLSASIAGSLDVLCSVSAEEFPLGIDVATRLGVILNELIINAAKHAGSLPGQQTAVRVELSRDDEGALRLTFSDSGPGLPAGMELERVNSLGLNIVRATVAQLGGGVVFEPGRGARVVVRIAQARNAGAGSA